MPAPKPHGAIAEYSWAYCAICDRYTYLMGCARGTNKAIRKRGVLIGIKCSKCFRNRAVSGSSVTGMHIAIGSYQPQRENGNQ